VPSESPRPPDRVPKVAVCRILNLADSQEQSQFRLDAWPVFAPRMRPRACRRLLPTVAHLVRRDDSIFLFA
jgi:hypothetical protein